MAYPIMISSTYMAERDSEDNPRPSERYLQMLRRMVLETFGEKGPRGKRAGGAAAKKAGRSAQTFSRTFNGVGKPTIRSANRFARALREAGCKVPPPWTPVIDEIDWEWIELGRNLKEASPEKFATLLHLLRIEGGASQTALDIHATIEKIVAKVTGSSAIVPGGDDGENE